MRGISKSLAVLATASFLAMTGFSSNATAQFGLKKVKVSVTNVSRQILSPVVVASHESTVAIFEVGVAASPELASLAEDAIFAALQSKLEMTDGVGDVGVIFGTGGPIMPGETASVEIEAFGLYRNISVVSMLVTTNDAFAAINGVRAPNIGKGSHYAVAYDAGSEANTESCDHIPGPPCGNPNVRVTAGAEGFVHVHPGIRGDGDVSLSSDWRNPVARVTVERVK